MYMKRSDGSPIVATEKNCGNGENVYVPGPVGNVVEIPDHSAVKASAVAGEEWRELLSFSVACGLSVLSKWVIGPSFETSVAT